MSPDPSPFFFAEGAWLRQTMVFSLENCPKGHIIVGVHMHKQEKYWS